MNHTYIAIDAAGDEEARRTESFIVMRDTPRIKRGTPIAISKDAKYIQIEQSDPKEVQSNSANLLLVEIATTRAKILIPTTVLSRSTIPNNELSDWYVVSGISRRKNPKGEIDMSLQVISGESLTMSSEHVASMLDGGIEELREIYQSLLIKNPTGACTIKFNQHLLDIQQLRNS